MATLQNTGLYLTGKVKGTFEKDATSKSGQPYKRRSIRVVFFPKGPEEEETRSTFISVPPGAKMPDVREGGVYTFPVDVSGGPDRAVYFSLNTHMPVQEDK